MIIRNEDINAYHANDADSNSSINDLVSKGPLYYEGIHIKKSFQRDTTKALIVGQAFEDFLCDIDGFDKKYVFKPKKDKANPDFKDWNGATKEGKAWKASHFGYIILDGELRDDFTAMKRNILNHPAASRIIAGCETQVSLRFDSKDYGMALQSRPDWINFTGNADSRGLPYSADLKTTINFNEVFDAFDPQSPINGRVILKNGYHRQAALCHYCGIQEPELADMVHFLIFIEKTFPYRVAVIELDPNYLGIGMRELDTGLKTLGACITANRWPLGPEDVIKLVPPQYAEAKAARLFNDQNGNEFHGEEEAA